MGELIMRLFHARTAAHVFHLQTRSYAAHKALESFYDDVVGIADSIAETYQGCEGLITSFPPRYTAPADALTMLHELYDWIDDHRAGLTDETQIQNLIDEACALINRTVYKLENLK